MGSSVSKEFREPREFEADGYPAELEGVDPDLDLGGPLSIDVTDPPGSGDGWIFGPEFRERRLEDVYDLRDPPLGKGHFGVVRVGVRKDRNTHTEKKEVSREKGRGPPAASEEKPDRDTVITVEAESMNDRMKPSKSPSGKFKVAWQTTEDDRRQPEQGSSETLQGQLKRGATAASSSQAKGRGRTFRSFFPEMEEEEAVSGLLSQAAAVVGGGCSSGEFAVKSIEKGKVRDVRLLRWEVGILRKLDHPRLLKLHDVFEDETYIHLVTDLFLGGEVFKRIHERGRLTEPEAARMMRMVVEALKWCHDRNIIHRDLKPENFLLSGTGDGASLIVIDFGLAIIAEPNTVLESRVGTYYYMSPELLGRRYNRPTDMWSCGVIAFVLLAGYPPFFGDRESLVLKRISSGHFTFDDPVWWGVSEEAKDFVARLLTFDPAARMTADEALRHPWVVNEGQESVSANHYDVLPKIRKFGLESPLKRLLKLQVAKLLSDAEKRLFAGAFQAMDADYDGYISKSDLYSSSRRYHVDISEAEVASAVQRADLDGDHRLSIDEFAAAMLPKHVYLQNHLLGRAFDSIDVDGDGRISKQDLLKWFPEDIVDTILAGSAGKRLGYLHFNAILRCVVGNEREVEFTRRRASGND